MKRRVLLRWASFGLSALWLSLARATTILAVRLWPAPDYSRITIESDVELKVRQTLLTDPPRLSLDIDGVALDATLRDLVPKLGRDDPNIASIRIGQQAPGVVRLLLEFKQGVTPQVFTLPPVAAYRHRLLLDLYPTRVEDPLLALINERLKTNPTQLPAPDPLGELIARQQNKSAPAPAPDNSTQQTADRLIIVALDPGHGGEDPGAIGPAGTREKDVVLQLALRLRERINAAQINGNPLRAFLTRDADFFVPLQARVAKAQRVQADLFISLHSLCFGHPRLQWHEEIGIAG